MSGRKRPFRRIQADFAKWDSETRRLFRKAGLKSRKAADRGDMAAAIEAHRAHGEWRVGAEIRALGEELSRDYPDSHLCKLINDHLRREEKSHRIASVVKDLNGQLAKAVSAFRFKVGSESSPLGEVRTLMAEASKPKERKAIFGQLTMLNEQIEPLIREGQRRLATEYGMPLPEYCKVFLRDEWQITENTQKLLGAIFAAGKQLVRLLDLDGQGMQDLFHYHRKVLDEVDHYFGPEPPTEQCFRALKALGFNDDQVRRVRFVRKPGPVPARASALNVDEDLRVVGNISSGAIWYRILTHEVGHLLVNTFCPSWPTIRSDPIFPYYGEILAELHAMAASTTPVLKVALEVDEREAESVERAMRRAKAIAFTYEAVRTDFSIRIWRDTSSSFDDIYAQVCADYGLGVPEPGAFFPPAVFDFLSPTFIRHAFGSCVTHLFLGLTVERAAKLWPLLIGETYHLWSKCSVADYLQDNGYKLEPDEFVSAVIEGPMDSV